MPAGPLPLIKMDPGPQAAGGAVSAHSRSMGRMDRDAGFWFGVPRLDSAGALDATPAIYQTGACEPARAELFLAKGSRHARCVRPSMDGQLFSTGTTATAALVESHERLARSKCSSIAQQPRVLGLSVSASETEEWNALLLPQLGPR